MTHVRKGRDFEAALKYWVDPDVYDALVDNEPGRIRSQLEVFYLERGTDLGLLNQLQNRKYLESLIFNQLAEGTLLSSVTDDASDPSHPRGLVHPSLYDSDDVTYDQYRRTLTAAGRTLRNVEIFEPNEIPTNVTRFPDWLSQYSDQLPKGAASPGEAAVEAGEFRHDSDYCHVTLRGREFNLTPTQAEVVRVLHEAWNDGSRWRHVEVLRAAVSFESAKLSDLFKRLRNWRELIVSDRRGSYRLNL